MIVNLKLPLTEITLPANIRDTSVIVSQLDAIKNNLSLKLKAVIAGSEYDSAAVLEYIAEIIGTKPRIAINPRRCVPSATKISSSGVSICIAGFELLSKGIFMYRAQNRKRHKFVCPIKRSKKFAKENPYCPWLHPSFVEVTGYYTYLRVDVNESIRASIDYGSDSFKRNFNKRISSERIFSRFLLILMQKPSVIGLAATANLCTIFHISVLAVAYFSSFVKEPNKIRLIKSFLPNF